MKSAVSVAALLALLTAAHAVAAEADAPLSGAKKELRDLQPGRGTTGTPSVKDGLKSGVPTMEAPPSTTVPTYTRPTPQKLEREKEQRKNAQKNWLVDGVQKLEADQGKKPLLPGEEIKETEPGDGEEKIDPADPAYLLKLYDKQKKTDDAKSAETKAQRAPRPDAFAPFLQDWMAASPVKDQLLGEMSRKATGTNLPAPSAVAGAPIGVRGAVMMPDLGRANGPAAAPNPYLADSASPVGPTAGSLPLLTAPVGPAVGLQDLVTNPAPAPLLQPVPTAAPADRKAPPPPLADDKKYFPQLNKF
ncbi:hypothetical protein Verru16b_02932 [Lacunisphaera limnophila]|uniref:Uncharacterized protein n=1 Tax=Lacunisphaera limnophila TaxID=1838286 RepID=A0A1D8AY67_9BACT|nr:hypothetical protein [Lacunisphaera limnophila]AOS45842.1 hypothetical protein Verru16b_02932 [Lacunisphaera limnophila]